MLNQACHATVCSSQKTIHRSKRILVHFIWIYVTVFNAGVLEITAAVPSHAGRYTCSARNPAGVAHKHVSLTVQGRTSQTTRTISTPCRTCVLIMKVSLSQYFKSLQKLGQWPRRYKWCCIMGPFCPAKFKVFPDHL